MGNVKQNSGIPLCFKGFAHRVIFIKILLCYDVKGRYYDVNGKIAALKMIKYYNIIEKYTLDRLVLGGIIYMRIAVCDDDIREQKKFEEALRDWDPSRRAEKFSCGTALLEAAKVSPHFDIVFLDIYLPPENGIEIAKKLHEISPETGIVFVTVSRDFAVDAFSVYAMHYIVKPVTTEGIAEAFRRIAEYRFVYRERITLTFGMERHTIFLDQICILESDDHIVNISLADGEKLRVRMSFCDLEKKMNKNFLKINRGILVNMDYIMKMSKNTCVMQNGIRLPITIRKSAGIRATYDNYVFERLSQRKGFGEDKL